MSKYTEVLYELWEEYIYARPTNHTLEGKDIGFLIQLALGMSQNNLSEKDKEDFIQMVLNIGG